MFLEFRFTFKYWYQKITEQRQNFANSDRYTNEDAEIILIGHRPSFCIHRPGMEDVLRGGSVRGTFVRTGACLLIQRWSIAAGQSRHVGRMESCWWHCGRFQDLRLLLACTLLQTDHIFVTSLSAYCVRACKIKHFTEREFSGIFSLAGGILRFQNGNSRWPWLSGECTPKWRVNRTTQQLSSN